MFKISICVGCMPVKLKTNEKGFTAEAICSFGCAFFSKQGDGLIFERKVHHKQIRINLFYHDKNFFHNLQGQPEVFK